MKALILFIVAKVVLARPQLDLPPLVGPPPVQIFVPDLHFVNEPEAPQPAPSAPLPQPPSTRPPPPPPPPPLPPQSAARISEAPYIDYKLKFSNVGDIVGYSYVVETNDGFRKAEDGEIRQFAPGDEGPSVTGRYSYVGQDGKLRNVVYVADEKGFRPKFEN